MIHYQGNNLIVFQSSLYKTNSSIIFTDDLVMVVDPTWLPSEIRAIRSYYNSINSSREELILFTHSDYDHILGWKAFPTAKSIASEKFASNNRKDHVIEQILKFDDDYYIDRNYPIQYPEIDFMISEDREELSIGNTSLVFFHSPGHNEDGLFTIIEPNGILVAGDYLSDVEFPFIYHSVSAYEESLKKARMILDEYDIRMLVPGHGTITKSVKEIEQRINDSQNYLDDLRSAVSENKAFDLEKLFSKYKYRRNMIKYHEANIELARKELLGSN